MTSYRGGVGVRLGWRCDDQGGGGVKKPGFSDDVIWEWPLGEWPIKFSTRGTGPNMIFLKDLVVLITTIYHTWLCHVGFQRCESHCIYTYMKLPHLFQCNFLKLHELTSLEPDVAQSSVIYRRYQDDEIFKEKDIWSHNSCAEFHRPFAYGQLAIAFKL